MATLVVTLLHDTSPTPTPVAGARIVFLSGTSGVAETSGATDASGQVSLTVTPTTTADQNDVIYCNGLTTIVADPDGIHSYESWTYLPSRHNWREDAQGLAVTIYTKPCHTFILKGYDSFGSLLRFGNYRDAGGPGNVFTAAYAPDYFTELAWVPGTKWGLLPEQYYGSVDDYSLNPVEVTGAYERLRHISLSEDGDQNELFRVPAIAIADTVDLSAVPIVVQLQGWPLWDAVGQRGLVALCTDPLSTYGIVKLNQEFTGRALSVLFGLWIDYDWDIDGGITYPSTFFGSTDWRNEYFALIYHFLSLASANPWNDSDAMLGIHYTTLLAKTLDFQERARYGKALADIEGNRKGAVTLIVTDGDDVPITKVQFRVQMTQRQAERDFLFGIMPGTSSSYSHVDVLASASALPGRLACFPVPWYQMAMVGNSGVVEQPGWDLNVTHYAAAFKTALGWGAWTDFTLRQHASIYLLAGLIPPSRLALSNADFTVAMLETYSKLLAAYGDDFALWEVCNEMGYSDCKGMTLAERLTLSEGALTLAATALKTTLTNSAHCKVPSETFDSDWDTGGTAYSVSEWFRRETTSYQDFLRQMNKTGLSSIGIQLYPGSRAQNIDASAFSNGPCPVPSHMLDLLDNYWRANALPMSITEFSLPSEAGADWLNGWWVQDWAHRRQGNWTPEVQADYAERAITYAFSHPKCHSLLWWDLIDWTESGGVKLGAAYDRFGRMKPVFERILAKVQSDWSSHVDQVVTTAAGGVSLPSCFGGVYDVVLTSPNGRRLVTTCTVVEGQANTVTLTWEDWA